MSDENIPELIPAGLCQCGCGEATREIRYTNPRHGHVRGEFFRFLPGHHARGRNNRNWKGGKTTNADGYVRVWSPDHPRALQGNVAEHVLVVETALGGPLPPGAVIHHVNGNKVDNRPQNLVVCEDNSYHMLLHRRQRALDACGNANYLLCVYCHEHDDPDNLYVTPTKGQSAYHRHCRAKAVRDRRAKKNGLLV